MKFATRASAWIRSHLPTREYVRHSMIYRILGSSVFAKDLWQMRERSVVDGLALGLFVAFTPTIPFQMVLATVGAVYFRTNLPVALAACWVTNPVTAIPIYAAAWRLGRWVLFRQPWLKDLLATHVPAGRLQGLIVGCTCLWIGSLILASGAAIAAGLVTQHVWRWMARRRTKPALSGRDTPAERRSG